MRLTKLERILARAEEDFPNVDVETFDDFYQNYQGVKNSEHLYYLLWNTVQDNQIPESQSESRETARSYFFSSPKMHRSNEKVESMLEFFLFSQNIVEGVYKCGNCGNRRTVSNNKQTRSADETTNVTIVCVDCGNTWTA